MHLRVICLLAIYVMTFHVKTMAQTFPWNTWAAGSFNYNRTVAGNTMNVVYSESGNFRGNTLATTECFSVTTTRPNVPFFYNAVTMYIADYSTNSCYCGSTAAASGLVLTANWPDQAYRWEQLDITFSTAVCGPVTFNIWDINQNLFGGNYYFTDKIDLSATDVNGVDVPTGNIVVGNCGSNTVTSAGNVKTISGVGDGCGCRSTSISITSGTVKTIRLRYWNGGSTVSANPNSQYVVITQIVASPPPTASITAAPLACGSTTTTLTANTNAPAPVTYQWTGPAGSTIANPSAQSTSVTGAGTYTLTVNPGGCGAVATYTLTPTGTPPDLTVAANQTATCSNPSISASSSTPGVSFAWTGPGIVSGGNTATPVVNASGTYTVTVTNPANGCVNTANVQVVVDKTPPVANAGPDKVLDCNATDISLDGTGSTPGLSYSWAGPGIFSGASTLTPTVNASGTYTLTVTNPANGCVATDNAVVTGSTGITPLFDPIPPFCTGDPSPVLPSTSLNGITGTWSPSVVSNTANGTYTFTPDSGQCSSPTTININLFPLPNTSVIFRD